MKKVFVLLALAFLTVSSAFGADGQIDNLGQGLSYKEIAAQLSNIEALTKSKKIDVDAMVNQIPYLNDMASKLDASRKNIDENIQLIEKRIEALGEVDDTVPEAKVIAQKRKEFNSELSSEKTRLSEIDILATKIDELNLRIFDIKSPAFTREPANASFIISERAS